MIIDISRWQKDVDYKKIDADRVILKATQGVKYIDPTYQERRSEFKKIGKKLGYYHFADGGNVAEEAEHFLKVIKPLTDELIVLDWEIEHPDPVDWCKTFLEIIQRATGIRPCLYTNEARLLRYDWTPCKQFMLWVAKYGVNDGKPGKEPKTGVWDHYDMWQYTSRGSCPGIKGNVDLSLEYKKPEDSFDTVIDGKTYYWQKDPRWKDQTINDTKSTIGAYGCFTCCLATFLGMTPSETERSFSRAGIYYKDLIRSERIPEAYPPIKYYGRDYNIDNMPSWYPSIKEVVVGNSQHFVNRVLVNGKKMIYDPLTGKVLPLNYYKFKSYRLFK